MKVVAVDFRGHPMFPSMGFTGDGHISRFNFKNGSVNFRTRHVKTDRLLAERKAIVFPVVARTTNAAFGPFDSHWIA
jgi:carotenoid cleavage dioxygenase-like enzyme